MSFTLQFKELKTDGKSFIFAVYPAFGVKSFANSSLDILIKSILIEQNITKECTKQVDFCLFFGVSNACASVATITNLKEKFL